MTRTATTGGSTTRDVRVAVQFLTRLPVRVEVRDEADLARAVPWFPVVGALVGLVVGGVAAALLGPLGPTAACTLGVAAGVLLTGAFHEDGLGDVADGFWGGWEPERRMEIMRDSRLGTYGVLALVLTMLLRVALLAVVADGLGGGAVLAAAVLGHVLSRAAAVALMASQPTARPDGLGAAYLASLAPSRAVVGAVAAPVLLAGLLGPSALAGVGLSLVAAGAAAAAVAAVARRKVGGITGDVLGATQQLAELAVLVVAAGLGDGALGLSRTGWDGWVAGVAGLG